jgi:hypothetical protein
VLVDHHTILSNWLFSKNQEPNQSAAIADVILIASASIVALDILAKTCPKWRKDESTIGVNLSGGGQNK